MSARRRSAVAALAIAFAIAAAAAGMAAVPREHAGRQASHIAVVSATPIQGTASDDALTGTSGDDVIDGAAGDDTIDAGAGNDFVVEGQAGNERRIDGGPGDDAIDGGAGNDGDLRGGLGNDIVFGGRGDDVIDGGPGNDRIDAGDGTDTSVSGAEGDDILLGGEGQDGLDGGPGDDVLVGGGSSDNLDGGTGNDVCYTDATFFEFTFGCEIVVETGASRASRDLVDESHPGVVTGGKNGLVKLRANREVARKGVPGTELANVLSGTDAAEAFKSGGGADTVSAAGGDDAVDCGAGNDTCGGGAGDDDLVGGPGDDDLVGSDGNDVIEGGPGIDKIVAGAGDDTIVPGEGDELRPAGVTAGAAADKAVDAGPGNDRIYAVGGGADTIDCGDGADAVEHDSTDVVADDCETKDVPLTFSASFSLTLSAQRISGKVSIKKPNTNMFVPLEPKEPIPVGSDVDIPGKSDVTIAVDVKQGTRPASASVSNGTVTVLGPSKTYPEALVMRPISRTPQRCGSLVAAAANVRGKKRRKSLAKKLKAKVQKATGPVATITRDIVAAAKATSWTTTQSCDGTRVSVTEGVVMVLDRRLSKTRSVSAGDSYFAKRRRR